MVLLQRKPHIGVFSPLGGKVRDNEHFLEAMERISRERFAIDPSWGEVNALEYSNAVVTFYAARDEVALSEALEPPGIELHRIAYWALQGIPPLLKTVKWLAPMAHHHLFHESIVLSQSLMAGSADTILLQE